MDKVSHSNRYYYLALFATLLAFTVVILGAYTRLKDAGLGCPDWPGCYGQLVVPKTEQARAIAQKLYPNKPLESVKAWAEMTHRYFAGSLVLCIFTLTVAGYLKRRKNIFQPIKVPLLLVACILFQAMLGMWTVTWQLLPLVVMGHLLGGMTIASLLWWLTLTTSKRFYPNHELHYLRPWVIAALLIVFIQIFLGGWTSANYASIICPDFPFCQGKLFPNFDFQQAFNFLRPIGQNYQGGILGTTPRITIHMMHRYWAFIATAYLICLNMYLLCSKRTTSLQNTAGFILLLLCTQVFLGIMNIVTSLYLPIAVSHNAVALLLLLSIVMLVFQLFVPVQSAPINLTLRRASSTQNQLESY